MLARAMVVVIDFIMKNHLYTFDGKVYRQVSGGPIGLELTGVLARIVMIWWDKEYLKKLKNLNIKLLLYKRYIDDQSSAVRAIKPGIRFQDEELVMDEDRVETWQPKLMSGLLLFSERLATLYPQ